MRWTLVRLLDRSPVHPITEELRMERLRRHLSIGAVADQCKVNRNTIAAHEDFKFSGLESLDRWARALGYELSLTKIGSSGKA